MPRGNISTQRADQNMARSAVLGMNFPPAVWLLLLFGSGVALLSANPLLTCVAIGILPIMAYLTWRPGEPPVLFFAVFFQWLQVSMAVFYANFMGKNISDPPNVPTMETAVWLSIAGIVILALGMRFGVDWKRTRKLGPGSSVTIRYSQKKIWIVYLVLFTLGIVLPPFLWHVNQLRTVVLGLLHLKWVAYFVLVYLAFARGGGLRNKYLLVGTALEILFGFSGYFSGYKQVFFILGIAFLTTRARLKTKDIVPLTAIILTVFFLSVCWSSIKTDYRDFLNQQTGQQVVLVPFSKRIQAVTEMVFELDYVSFMEGMDKLAQRIAYVEMFARVVETVPQYLPHEGGRLWWAAIKHVSVPRLLYPAKAALPSDSELTSRYTRVFLAGAEQGTSISMGYMAESYIDFGMVGMYVPIFLCGLLWGLMYRYFMRKVPYRVIAYGMVTALLVNANQFEMHSVKLLGGMLMNFLVFAAVVKFILPKYQ